MLVLTAVAAGIIGFALGAFSRRTTADRLLDASLQALDASERDVAHWQRLARYWQHRAEAPPYTRARDRVAAPSRLHITGADVGPTGRRRLRPD
jgi:hypothetical protein